MMNNWLIIYNLTVFLVFCRAEMNERTKQILRLAREKMMNEENDLVNSCSPLNVHEMPTVPTLVTNINQPPSMPNHDHDQPNQCGAKWNIVQSTSTTVSLKKVDSPELCTSSDESEVYSSGSGEMYEPSSSGKPSSSDSSPPRQLVSNTNNVENQPNEAQLGERSPTVRGKKEQEMSATGAK